MPNESQPTPGPWRAVTNTVRAQTNYGSGKLLECCSFDGPTRDEANAAHIVRCVNAHDALVSALEGILTKGFSAQAEEQARAALRTAKGEA